MFKLFKRFKQVVLYKFTLDNGSYVYYTNYKRDFVFNGITYKSTRINHGKLYSSMDKNKLTVDIVMDKKHPLVNDYILSRGKLSLLVEITHVNFDNTSDYIVVFRGGLISAYLQGSNSVFKFEDLLLYLNRISNAQNISTICPHDLYGAQCRATPIVHLLPVAAINGTKITVTGLAALGDNYSIMGRASFGLEYKSIIKQVGNDIWVPTPFSNLSVGDTLSITAGCDKLATTCRDRFNNLINFGGFKYLPSSDLFADGSRIA